MQFWTIAAGISLFNATLQGAKAARVAFNNHERLSEKSEVVELLLKDYEEQATEWLWQTDQEGLLLSAPDQVLEMCFPLAEDEKNINLFDLLSQSCTEASTSDIEHLWAAVSEKKEFHDVRLSIKSPLDGELRWIFDEGSAHSTNMGNFRAFVGFSRMLRPPLSRNVRCNFSPPLMG